MNRKFATLVLGLSVSALLLSGCSQTATPANAGAQQSAGVTSSTTPADRAEAAIDWQYKTVSDTQTMLENGESVIVLDSRQDDMYNEGHIKGAYHVACFPMDTPELENVLKEAVPNLQGDAPIVIVCKTGNKGAKRAISYLQDQGIAASRLYILEGGGEEWLKSGSADLTTKENDSVTPSVGS